MPLPCVTCTLSWVESRDSLCSPSQEKKDKIADLKNFKQKSFIGIYFLKDLVLKKNLFYLNLYFHYIIQLLVKHRTANANSCYFQLLQLVVIIPFHLNFLTFLAYLFSRQYYLEHLHCIFCNLFYSFFSYKHL